MPPPPLLEIQQVHKRFGAVTALHGVSLTLAHGQIYGLAGANGAGKSTLIKILGGVHPPDSGSILLKGQQYAPRNPAEAQAAGVIVFHQEIPVCPNLSVAANVFLGPKLAAGRFFPDWKQMEGRCQQLFRELVGVEVDASRPMGQCSAAERQLALLVRVLSRHGRLIILDEPTTALTGPEVARLFQVLRRLREQGITFVFVSHLLDELTGVSDEIHVLRDGQLVGHLARDEFDARRLASLIAGRSLTEAGSRASRPSAPCQLEVRDLSSPGHFAGVSFTLRQGEILAVTGLQGSGRSAVAKALFASPPAGSGEILLNGNPVRLDSPKAAIRAGIGYLPEDRKTLGLFDDLDIASNLGILRLNALTQRGWLRPRRLTGLALEMQRKVPVKMSDPAAPIGSLSGGNQQKVLISRWLSIRPRVLVMNEPTRGVDIGAKDEICQLLCRLADEGCSFLISSSDLDEILRLADRILVMRRGRIAAEFSRSEASKEKLVHAAGSGSA